MKKNIFKAGDLIKYKKRHKSDPNYNFTVRVENIGKKLIKGTIETREGSYKHPVGHYSSCWNPDYFELVKENKIIEIW